MNRPTLIDNFFDNPDEIRNYALGLEYRKSTDQDGWLGYRCFQHDENFGKIFSEKLANLDFIFDEMIYYFHYCLEENKNYNKLGIDFHKYKIHEDNNGPDFAGVVYLFPNPPKNTGTSFFDEEKNYISSIENKYNRFICYPSNINHGPTDLFGDTIENGRLTLTFFCK